MAINPISAPPPGRFGGDSRQFLPRNQCSHANIAMVLDAGQILQWDQQRRQRRQEIERYRGGAQDVLDQMQAPEQAEREQRHPAAPETTEDKLAEARREWEARLTEACEKRVAAEVTGEDDGPDRLEKLKQQLCDVGNVDGSLDQVENKSVGVQGAWNEAALRALGAYGPAHETAKSVEAMDKTLGVGPWSLGPCYRPKR